MIEDVSSCLGHADRSVITLDMGIHLWTMTYGSYLLSRVGVIDVSSNRPLDAPALGCKFLYLHFHLFKTSRFSCLSYAV